MLAEGTEARETTMARPNYQETPIEEKGMSQWRQHLGDGIPLDQFDSADSEYANRIFGRRILDEISQGQDSSWMDGRWRYARYDDEDGAMVDRLYEENRYRPIRYR